MTGRFERTGPPLIHFHTEEGWPASAARPRVLNENRERRQAVPEG